MKTALSLLEGITTEIFATGIGVVVIGLLGLWQGWVAYTEPAPRFVLNYRGWSCPPLSMLYGGGFMICMGVFMMSPTAPEIFLQLISVTCIACLITFLIGFFFWFPPFLVPRWYHRARKAGVPRHDITAMAAFKALPKDQQKQAAAKARR